MPYALLSVQFFDFIAADLDSTGTADFLVAAYTNGFSGIVRVLRKQNGSATIAAEPVLPLMGGIYPSVSLVDLDNDLRPEVVVNLTSATGSSADWIFKWTGSGLNLFGPSQVQSDGNISTLLGDAALVDLDGDGVPEILNPPERTFDSDPTIVYHLSGGSYLLNSTRVYFLQTYIRRTGTPVTDTDTFTVPDTTVSYVMIITNGDSSGSNRASSVTVTLNGNSVGGTNQFNQQVLTLRIPITITSLDNVLSVRFAGVPQSQISIAIAVE